MMQTPTLDDYVASNANNLSLSTVSARQTFNPPGTMGIWMLDAEHLIQIYGTNDPSFPNGNLVFREGHGIFAVELQDFPGWHPIIAIKGIDESRAVNVTTWYGWDGAGPVSRTDQAGWDANLQRHLAMGPSSDGSLSGNGANSRIIVDVTGPGDWEVHDAWVGWMQPVPAS